MHNDRITYAERVPSVLGAIFNDYETSDLSYIHEWSFHGPYSYQKTTYTGKHF